jgi:hypothetical protein
MNELEVFFEERKKEVNIYFDFINPIGIDRASHKNIKFDSRNELRTTNELKQVLKSNCILILYNLIEGVVSKSIEYVMDSINDQEIKYGDLKPGLKQIILKSTTKIKKNDFKDRNVDLVNYLDSVFDEIFDFEMNKENKKIIMSGGGNIDARFIREEIAAKLHMRFSRKEDCLVSIKNDRNSLAHGSKSYISCSRDKTLRDIKKDKTKVFTYLKNYVNAITKYVDNEGYKL